MKVAPDAQSASHQPIVEFAARRISVLLPVRFQTWPGKPVSHVTVQPLPYDPIGFDSVLRQSVVPALKHHEAKWMFALI